MNQATIHVQQLSQAMTSPVETSKKVASETKQLVAEKQKAESSIPQAGTHPKVGGISTGPVVGVPPGPKPFQKGDNERTQQKKEIANFVSQLDAKAGPQPYKSSPDGWKNVERYPQKSNEQNLALAKPGVEAAINKYTGNTYTAINDGLRKKNINDFDEDTKKIAVALDMATRTKLKKEATVYRGIQSGAMAYDLTHTPIGGSVTDSGFSSTTTNLQVARKFGTTYNGGVLMKVKTKVGLPISSISKYASEREVLLPRNTRYTITKKSWQKIGGKWSMVVEAEASIGDE